MKRWLLVLGLLLFPSVAFAQCTGTFPAGTGCSNTSGGQALPRANPLPNVSIATYAALQSNVVAYPYITLLGYYAAGDGGGGLLAYIGNSGSANGCTIYEDGNGHFYERVSPQPVNAAWCGVKPDAGSTNTDNTTAFQNAINAAGSGTLLIPQGGYCISTGGLSETNPQASIQGIGGQEAAALYACGHDVGLLTINALNVQLSYLVLCGNGCPGDPSDTTMPSTSTVLDVGPDCGTCNVQYVNVYGGVTPIVWASAQASARNVIASYAYGALGNWYFTGGIDAFDLSVDQDWPLNPTAGQTIANRISSSSSYSPGSVWIQGTSPTYYVEVISGSGPTAASAPSMHNYGTTWTDGGYTVELVSNANSSGIYDNGTSEMHLTRTDITGSFTFGLRFGTTAWVSFIGQDIIASQSISFPAVLAGNGGNQLFNCHSCGFGGTVSASMTGLFIFNSFAGNATISDSIFGGNSTFRGVYDNHASGGFVTVSNSQFYAGASSGGTAGIEVSAGVTGFNFHDNNFTNFTTGILVPSGASDYYNTFGTLCPSGVSTCVSDIGSGTHKTISHDGHGLFGIDATTPTLYGGAGAGSTLTLQSTSNGSPSGDQASVKASKFEYETIGGTDVLDCNVTTSSVCQFNQKTIVAGAPFGLSGNQSAVGWGTNGIRYVNVAATLTDTSDSGTVSAAYTNVFGGDTIAASSATTFTNYYATYFKAPVAGSGATLTNKWALGADSLQTNGNTEFNLGSDATGDLYYRASSGLLTRLAIGSSGNVLGVSGGTPTWGSFASECTAASASVLGCVQGDGATLSINGSGVISINLAHANTWSAIQTHNTGDLVINGGTATAGLATVTSGGVVNSEANATVAQGGTNCVSASGACLDNITGFSSTGFINRTGAGTYSFSGSTGSGNVVLAGSPTFTGTITMPDTGTWGSGGINGSAIGSSTAAAAKFTTLASSGLYSNTSASSATLYAGDICNAISGYSGFAVGNNGSSDCTHYSFMGDGTNSYFNAPGSTIYFRIANSSSSQVTSLGWQLNGYLAISAPTAVLSAGEIGSEKISASGTAPGSGLAKFEWVAGTNSGSCKLISYAGTSTTPVAIVDNVGSGC